MDASPLLDRLLDDEGITAGLDEADATTMIRALGDHVRRIAAATDDSATAIREVEQLCRKARRIAEDLAALPAAADRAAELKRKLSDLMR
jgi:hypothetical protein